jgi:hypothetical protein
MTLRIHVAESAQEENALPPGLLPALPNSEFGCNALKL